MGYVAVKGGTSAIDASLERLKYERLKNFRTIKVDDIEASMRCLIDQLMSESSLYDEYLSSIAIKQAEGSPEEAVFILRAYRSTLSRNYYSCVTDTKNIFLERRISASFKDIPGGQILGATQDYSHRLLDFDLSWEEEKDCKEWVKKYLQSVENPASPTEDTQVSGVIDYLEKQGLLRPILANNTPPDDVTKESVQFPCSRSQRLQLLSRGQTGAVIALGYAAIRGYGAYHPTVAELRVGQVPIFVESPLLSEDEEEAYYIGDIKVTEVETLFPVAVNKNQDKKEIKFEIGYGLCYGQNESKAIAMSILDHCLETANPKYPTHNEEFVLMHIDPVEATGFISHLKLPHYVTFQSELDAVRKTVKEESDD
jgi:alpha-D-ribose 1-methylphosphonate 5-triphosphate synthase subunit PhnI